MKEIVIRNRPVSMFPNHPQGISEVIRLFLINDFIEVIVIETKIIMIRYTTDIKLIQLFDVSFCFNAFSFRSNKYK